MKFYLHFLSDNYGKHYIDEPIGYSNVDFQLKQEEGRYARDISFGGGENPFEFTKWREHELPMLIYYFQTFGYESRVRFVVEFDNGNDNIVGDLDFKEAETDEITYFKCKVIQDSLQALIKKRMDIKVDCFSDRTLDDDPITPLVPEKILLKAKPINQLSKWTTPAAANVHTTVSGLGGQGGFINDFFSFTNVVQEYGIENTLSFIQGTGAISDFAYLEAENDLENIVVTIKNFKALFTSTGAGLGGVYLAYYAGLNPTQGDLTQIPQMGFNLDGAQYYTVDLTDISITIPFLSTGQRLYLPFGSYNLSASNSDTHTITAQIQSLDIEITATSIAYNTVVDSFRLVDVMRYVVKSVSGADIDAPRFESLGQFYDQRLFNGNFLRGLKDKPFYITMKQIQEGLQEMNADHEVQYDGTVFFGLFEDFYTSNEIAFINEVQFDTFKKSYNERFALNEFSYKYKSYQSQKENTIGNSYDVVHGESQFMLRNVMVENKKEIDVEWIRDAFEIELNKRNSLEVKTDTATQTDDKLYIIDCIDVVSEEERYFTESAKLLHVYEPTTNYLVLKNDGSFNWVLLGVTVGEYFEILQPQANANIYTVVEVNPTFIKLNPAVGSPTSNGERLTRFKYYIPATVFTQTIWTNQDFTLIAGLLNGQNYANLRYTIKRNIINFWSRYLASANLYCKKAIKNTFYKNNPDCETVYQGIQVKEGEDFLPENPILSPIQYNEMVFIVDYDEFVQIQDSVRSIRGFIRVLDNNGTVVKVYPKEMKYISEKKELQVIAEEKYEPDYMKITTQIPGLILINNETRLHEIKWKIIDKKLFIFDENEELMYNGVFWQKVSINGANPTSETELKQWLNLL